MRTIKRAAAACAAAVVAAGVSASAGLARKVPPPWTNCTRVNQTYHHGVGRANAHDKTKSGDPVTNFKRSTALYLKAIKANPGLDRDKGGIACEKK